MKIGFPSLATAQRWLARREQEGIVRILGNVRFQRLGRPTAVYGGRACSANNLMHDVLRSKFALPYWLHGWDWSAGDEGRTRADGVLRKEGGLSLFVEIDRSTEGRRQLISRLFEYSVIEGFVLFVTDSEKRIWHVVEAVSRDLRIVGERLLLTTAEEARTSPFGEIWRDIYGGRTSL